MRRTGDMLDSGRDLSSGLLRKIAGEKPHTLGSQHLGFHCGQKVGIASASGRIYIVYEFCQKSHQKRRSDRFD
jgi:hypothetical protein